MTHRPPHPPPPPIKWPHTISRNVSVNASAKGWSETLQQKGAVAQPLLWWAAGAVAVAGAGLLVRRCLGRSADIGTTDQIPRGTIPEIENGYLHIPKGHLLFHGTRWQEGTQRWWETSMPNRVDEDGGISFTLDPSSTPKVINAQIVIAFRATRLIKARVCKSKGEFYQLLNSTEDVCYARHEQEVKFRTSVTENYLRFDRAYRGRGQVRRMEDIV